MPTVSVIMLAFNKGPYLAAAIDSILAQTMRDFELVLVDDASTDGSVEKVLATRTDSRIRFIRNKENLGMAPSYMRAIPMCGSPWIAIMDADDISHPMRLEIQLSALSADPSLDAVSTAMEMIDEENRPLGSFPTHYTPDEIAAYAPVLMPLPHPTLMCRAELFRDIGYRFEFRSADDYDMVTRALEAGFKFGGISIPLYRYRRYAGSSTVAKPRAFDVYTCAVRLCAARRRAALPERLAEAMDDARTRIEGRLPMYEVYKLYSRECAVEGHAVPAAVHAALAVRERPAPMALLLLSRRVAAAIRRDRGSGRKVFVGALKGIFGVLLRSASEAHPTRSRISN
jgi:glycosyltransferase involved in cell wall biosynthesis